MENAMDAGTIKTGDSLDFDMSNESKETANEFRDEQVEETKQETPKQAVSRDTTIDVDGKQYSVSEKTLRAYYNVPPNEELTDKEYKSMLSSYKQAIHYNNATREAKNQQAQIQQFVQSFQTDPKGTLKQMFQSNNKQLQQIAEEIILEQMEEEMLDPREKELRDLRAEKERYARELEEEKKRIEEEEQQRMSSQYAQQFEQDIINVLETSSLPKTENTVKRLAQYKLLGLQKNMDVPFTKIAEMVQADLENEISQLFGAGKIEQLIKLIGEDKLKEIRKQDLSRIKQVGTTTQRTASQPESNPKSSSITPEEFRKQAQQRLMKAMR